MALRRENIDRLFDYGVLLDSRTIFLTDVDKDGIDDAVANSFLKALHALECANQNPIQIILRSGGGCVFSGLAIYDAIKSSPCHITATVYGHAMSMASIILQAADLRVMHQNSLLLLHDGTFGSESDWRSYEAWGEMARQLRKQSYKILADRTGKTVQFWERKLDRDLILWPDQALEYGLIDHIANSPRGEDHERS
jgi:ATP-dependent Clp protease protease subunit